jgi:hypothetical protein
VLVEIRETRDTPVVARVTAIGANT